MATPTLTVSVDGALPPFSAVHRADLAWDGTTDTQSTLIQRQRASGHWEDIAVVPKFLPTRFSEFVRDGVRTYRVIRTRRVGDALVEEVSNEVTSGVGLNVSTDNGFDPILGAPYPPVNYQMTARRSLSGAVLLEWNVPSVFLDIAYSASDFAVTLSLTNYLQGDAVASQSGTTVTVSGGGFSFIPDSETPNQVGYEIAYGITHDTTLFHAVIQSVTSTTTATVTPSQTVSTGRRFALIPPGPGGGSAFTTFDLYRWDGVSQWPRVGESTNSYTNRVQFNEIFTTGLGPPADALLKAMTFYAFEKTANPGNPVYGFVPGVPNNYYVRAVSGSTEVFSNVVSITV